MIAMRDFGFSFSTLIEADHQYLDYLVGQLLYHTHTTSKRSKLLSEITWRLIRHDVSEELVMRPAFEKYMGDEGKQLAEHDRQDHRALKEVLLEILRAWQTLPFDSDDGKVMSENERILLAELKDLARDMKNHMVEESGVVLPQFHELLTNEQSLSLGNQYARTFALMPHMSTVFHKDMDVYMSAEYPLFQSAFSHLTEMSRTGEDLGSMDLKIEEELMLVGVVKPRQEEDANKPKPKL